MVSLQKIALQPPFFLPSSSHEGQVRLTGPIIGDILSRIAAVVGELLPWRYSRSQPHFDSLWLRPDAYANDARACKP